jgi:hypothetical protein
MFLFGMFGGTVRVDVPSAVVAGWNLFVATIAVERATQEELFQPRTVLRIEIATAPRDVQIAAARSAAQLRVGFDDGGEVIVNPAWHNSLARTQWARDAQLSGDGLANEIALVGQLVQEGGQFLLDLKGDNRDLGGVLGLTLHINSSQWGAEQLSEL